jgi:hypothetical protein
MLKAKKARKARKKTQETAPLLLSPGRSKFDIYQMDLGTMGIPREIAHQNFGSNFLFSSNTKVGPGDYNPDTSIIEKRAPAISFRPPSAN